MFVSDVAKRLLAGLIVVALAVGVWVLWPRQDSDAAPTTSAVAVDTTLGSTTATVITTTTSLPPTSTSGSHVVETVEEAEEILRELWFGWFEGIYNQDQDRIREVVASQAFLDAGLSAFQTLEFLSEPTRTGIHFEDVELLDKSTQCTAVWVSASVDFLGDTTVNQSVDVLRWTGQEWSLFSTWRHRDDLWETDCEALLEPLS